MPQKIDLKIYRGDDVCRTFRLKDEIGAPLDLSQYTAFAAHIKKDKNQTVILAELSFDATESDLATGKIVLTLDAADTLTLPRVAWYDFQFQNADGKIITPFYGNILVEKDVSNPPPFAPGTP